MKIIISPAKTFNFSSSSLDNKDFNFLPITKMLIDRLNCLKSNKLYKALDLYDGLCFKSLKKFGLSKIETEYLEKNLYILSALYGCLRPNEYIYPYRMDFNMHNELGNLYKIWKDEVYKIICKDPNEVIINLASDEFSKLITPFIDKSNLINVEFGNLVDGKLKKHSTISKKGRGLMTWYLAHYQIKDYNEIKNFNLDNFVYNSVLSSDNDYIFVNEV